MTLAGDEDDVLRPGFGDGCVNGFATPAYFARLRRTLKHLPADIRRILAARIVIGDDHQIARLGGGSPHRGALAVIPVSAGTENGYQAAGNVRAQRSDGRLKRIGRVCVIDIDRRIRRSDRRAFEPPANRLQARDRVPDLPGIDACGQLQGTVPAAYVLYQLYQLLYQQMSATD